ncbi:SpoIID/LytB domain-containing protein [Paenibacillus pinistramenti]|uniref:SpoIID/LytB domain-containing protein n=1 Tax=Paenibacillus pinistramenti TaxID=1768003 RepID=UPI001108D1AF|nr:SpoIID/LytB domain-containing protein [Paenibacillus pinistramenti]
MKSTGRLTGFMKWGRSLGAGLLALGVLYMPVKAENLEGQSTDLIRVAMFLDLGSTYKSTTPSVTLVSSGGLSAGPGTEGSYQNWIQASAGEAAKFSVNAFRVKVMETSSFSTAASAAKKLQATANKPLIFAEEAGGATVYKLYAGMYATAEDATKAVTSITTTLGSLLGSQKPEARGKLYLSAGQFSSAYDAQTLRDQILSQGIDAWEVLTPGAGDKPAYSVWIGEAATEAQLAADKASLSAKLPNAAAAEVDDSAPALVIQTDVTSDLSNPAETPLFMLTGSGAKLWIDTGDSGVTEVKERSDRKYRGGFEISMVNGQLAFVNELPVEQYLYSVVGGEVSSSWPIESLKAQAVAARSYALFQSPTKFKIAGVVDTTLSQVYSGTGTEADSIRQAVDSTAGEVLMSGGKMIEGVFSSNSGGMTADPSEVWGNPSTVYAAVTSVEDNAASAGSKQWYHVLLSSGKSGYVREDNTKLTGASTAAGLSYLTVTASSTNVRPLPMIQSGVDPVAKMNPGDQAVVLEKVNESNSYSWVRGPFTSSQIASSLKGKISGTVPSSITSLEVTKRGPSGRAVEVQASGQVLKVKYPDLYRSAFGSLPSTLFDIVETGRYTVLGANGQTDTGTMSSGTTVLSASGKTTVSGSTGLVVMNGDKSARVIEKTNGFLFIGQGNGHGLGMSQWGAKGMADAGYDYQSILQHYYQNVTITKE